MTPLLSSDSAPGATDGEALWSRKGLALGGTGGRFGPPVSASLAGTWNRDSPPVGDSTLAPGDEAILAINA